MPYSLKQLDQRYQNVCDNLKDAKEYTLQHLKTTIQMDLEAFFNDLHAKNLEEYGAEIDMIEETIHQCRVAIRNEKSRRFLQDDIQRMTDKNTEKTMQKHAFKLKRRRSLLRKATPYQMQSKDSIGH